jgi:hypothetical protein
VTILEVAKHGLLPTGTAQQSRAGRVPDVGDRLLIGRIKFGSFSLRIVVGTLLAGVLIGQFDIKVPSIVEQIFFALFLFTTDYKVGVPASITA